jgi:glutamyl-tRNA reductase
MVVGEPQILGQIKEAYRQATRHKTSGVVLNRLMHRAFHTAKRVRTETGICGAAVSISFAAVELAKKIFYPLDDKKVLLVGAGEMAELACKHLMSHGVSRMAVANRTFERGVQLADRFGAAAVGFEEIESQLIDADIVVASTAFPGYVVTHEMVKNSLRKRRSRPLFFVDIAVPRDVEPEVNSLSNVYVYDMDDLKGVVDLNKEQRQQEAVRAERIVKEEVVKFEKWLDTLSVVPTIVSLREKADSIIQAELKKSASALTELTPAQMSAVKILTRSIAEKVISDPIVFLKKKADRPVVNAYLDVTRKLFGLDDNGGNMDS